ncbi:MAG: hypothetical protein R8P61_25280 [Bacteroidia bacterium]|nr:hypothetical protein [Bacteroidia bacterium]
MKYFLSLAILFFTQIGIAQESGTSVNHILKFEFEIADTLLNKLDSRVYDKQGKKMQVANNRLYLKHQLDTLARNAFDQELEQKNYPISSNEVLRDFIKFGMDNSPLALNLKSAIKNLGKKGYKGDTYFAVSLKIAPGGIQLMAKGIKPQVEINLRQFDASGKVVKRIIEKQKASEAMLAYVTRDNPHLSGMVLESKKGLTAKKGEVLFDKSRREFIDILIEELRPLLEAGVSKAVSKLE